MQQLYLYPFLPHNYIVEEIILGIVLIYPQMFCNIINIIKIDYFFLESHQIIYVYLRQIYKTKQLNTISLLSNLSRTNLLYKIGGISKIVDMMKQSQTFVASSNINIYVEELIQIIHTNYVKRLMIQYAYHIIQLAHIYDISNITLYNKASYSLNIAENKIVTHTNQRINNLQELVSNFLINFTKNNNNQQKINDFTTSLKLYCGFQALDEITSGLPNGDLIVIAGRPSMGKTSLAINIAYNILNQRNLGICIFSLEMSSKQIAHKLISIASNVPILHINNYILDNKDWYTIKIICKQLINCYLKIDDRPNMSIDHIEYTSTLLKRDNARISLIIIDYLQLIQIETAKNINRSQELSYITRKLKLLAQSLKLPVIILSQLNRSIENRSSKIPILSDLKESGCIYYKSNILLNSHLDNYINIVSVVIKSYTTIQISNIRKNHYLTDIIFPRTNINILIQYIFYCNINTYYSLLLTHNHKYLDNNIWIKTHSIIDNSIITQKAKKQHTNIKQIFHNQTIDFIKFYNYSQAYDLITPQYYNFISEDTILHNSIEQDADIVIMIYRDHNNKKIIEKQTVLDMMVAKNRNGPTGPCQLLFYPETTIFNNMDMLINFDTLHD